MPRAGHGQPGDTKTTEQDSKMKKMEKDDAQLSSHEIITTPRRNTNTTSKRLILIALVL